MITTRSSAVLVRALLLLTFAAPALAQNAPPDDKSFGSQYDKFKDETSVAATAMLESVRDGNGLITINQNVQMGFALTHRGQKPTALPATATIVFITRARAPLFSKNDELHALADGERLAFGRASGYGISREQPALVSFGCREIVKFDDVPIDKFLRLVRAERVELRLGDREMPLSGEHLQTYRKLLSYFGAQSAPSEVVTPTAKPRQNPRSRRERPRATGKTGVLRRVGGNGA